METTRLVPHESVFDERPKTQPIEVWLSQPHLQISCRIVYEDERTDSLIVESLSMRGAQREVTGFLMDHGYTPAGRWELEQILEGDREGVAAETSRRFRPGRSSRHSGDTGGAREGGQPAQASPVEGGPFYVYENWTNTFACIHKGACSFCNHGEGTQRRGSHTSNGQWHGRFSTLEEAHIAAREAAYRHPNREVWSIHPCGFCLRAERRRWHYAGSLGREADQLSPIPC